MQATLIVDWLVILLSLAVRTCLQNLFLLPFLSLVRMILGCSYFLTNFKLITLIIVIASGFLFSTVFLQTFDEFWRYLQNTITFLLQTDELLKNFIFFKNFLCCMVPEMSLFLLGSRIYLLFWAMTIMKSYELFFLHALFLL